MGGGAPGAESMASVLNALQTNLPGLSRVITGLQPEVAKVQAETDAATAPVYAQSQLDLLTKYGPALANAAGVADRAAAKQASQTELDVASGTGSELVTLADKLARQLDPEFYSNRAAVGAANDKLLGSIDPTRLTGSEREELEGAVARAEGFKNPRSSMDTVSKALKFGSRLDAKKQNFANLVASTASTMPALRSGMSGINIATGRESTSGAATVPSTPMGTGNNIWGLGGSTVSGATQLQGIQNSRRKDTWDKIQQGVGMASTLLGAFK